MCKWVVITFSLGTKPPQKSSVVSAFKVNSACKGSRQGKGELLLMDQLLTYKTQWVFLLPDLHQTVVHQDLRERFFHAATHSTFLKLKHRLLAPQQSSLGTVPFGLLNNSSTS